MSETTPPPPLKCPFGFHPPMILKTTSETTVTFMCTECSCEIERDIKPELPTHDRTSNPPDSGD